MSLACFFLSFTECGTGALHGTVQHKIGNHCPRSRIIATWQRLRHLRTGGIDHRLGVTDVGRRSNQRREGRTGYKRVVQPVTENVDVLIRIGTFATSECTRRERTVVLIPPIQSPIEGTRYWDHSLDFSGYNAASSA